MKHNLKSTSRLLITAILAVGFCLGTLAQDARERNYLYPVLKPIHEPKPLVSGWATQRITEKLNRGLTVSQTGINSVYLSWRLLATDSKDISFNIYRTSQGQRAVKINKKPVFSTTDFSAKLSGKSTESGFFVRPVFNGKELESSEPVSISPTLKFSSYTSVKLQGNYKPQRIAVADLNGDGTLDFIMKQPDRGIDPGGQPNTDGLTYKIEAYLSDGTFLWQKDLGPGIEPGIWYSPFIAYDFDGDGKAEIAVKTGPPDAREADGRVRKGPEWCSILNGMTGKEICRVDWPGRSWRFGDYNRINRNQMGMAFLDGKTPCLLIGRGTYRLMMVDAYQLTDGKLQKIWRWDGDEENPIIRHQGAHGMHTADVDGDGRDEVVLGSVVLDDNGTALWSTGLGHPDKCYVTDIDPERPGLEIFNVYEDWNNDGNGICLVDAKTGALIWGVGKKTLHVGDGMVADILPDVPGLECFAAEDSKGGSRSKYLLSAKGKIMATDKDVPGCRNWIFWDADKVRENIVSPGFENSMWDRFNVNKLSIVKYKGDTLTTAIEGSVIMMADISGDWREELITILPGEVRIYSTTIPAKDRRICLMQDPFYRTEVAHRSMGYEQSPVTSYYLGE
jgi:rhamnogalacturonan endolyase